MWGLIRYGIRNLARSRRRSALTALSTAIGAGGVVYTLGLIRSLLGFLMVAQVDLQHTGHLTVLPPEGASLALIRPWDAHLDAAAQATIATVLAGRADVVETARVLQMSALLSNGCDSAPASFLGVEPDHLQHTYASAAGRQLAPELYDLGPGQGLWAAPPSPAPLMVARGLATLLGKPRVLADATAPPATFLDCAAPDLAATLAADASLQIVGRTWDGRLSVADAVAVAQTREGFTEFENSRVLAPLADVQRWADTDAVSWVAVWLDHPDDAAAEAPRLQAALVQAGVPTQVLAWGDPRITPNYAALAPLMQVMGAFVTAILLGVVALSLVGGVTLSLAERARELGTLRAVGFQPRHLLPLVLAEACALALLGAVPGALAGLGLGALTGWLGLPLHPPAVAGTLALRVVPGAGLVALTPIAVVAVCAGLTVLAARRPLGRPVTHLLHDLE